MREQRRKSIHERERFVESLALLQVGEGGHQVIAKLFNRQHVAAVDRNNGERFEHAAIAKQRGIEVALLTQQVGFHERCGETFVGVAMELASAGVLLECSFRIAF